MIERAGVLRLGIVVALGLGMAAGGCHDWESLSTNYVDGAAEVSKDMVAAVTCSNAPRQFCNDDKKDCEETDVDCGGTQCTTRCEAGETCLLAGDCQSQVCLANNALVAKTCRPASCADQMKDNDETDVDCGGKDCVPCENGQMCAVDTDCKTDKCSLGFCAMKL